MTLLELAHWIVATLGLTETLVLMLAGLVWLIYSIWTRQSHPPRGFWRWGAWLPMAYCVYGTVTGLRNNWLFYKMMIAAEAFNEPQAELFRDSAVRGAVKLLLVGVVVTILIHLSMRRLPRNPA